MKILGEDDSRVGAGERERERWWQKVKKVCESVGWGDNGSRKSSGL